MNKLIRHNLELLKDLLARTKKGIAKAWIETKTGEIEKKAPAKKKHWVAVHIRAHVGPHGSSLMISEETSEKLFHFEEWTPEARRVVLETVQAANDALFAKRKKHSDREVIRQAWHDVDRVGAEDLLKGHAPGTYIFRKDDFADVLETSLHSRFGKSPHCVTLTYVDKTGIVRDKTLVFKNSHVQVYNDDPQLLEPRFETVEEAMFSIDPMIASPLKTKIKMRKAA